MKRKRRFLLKYKILFVMILVLSGGFLLFFSSAFRTFIQDKKRFVMDLNLATVDAATGRATLEISRRLGELQLLIPWAYSRPIAETTFAQFPKGIEKLPSELLDLSFYQSGSDHRLTLLRRLSNPRTITERKLPPEDLLKLLGESSSLIGELSKRSNLGFWNRSISGEHPYPILTLVLRADTGQTAENLFVVVNLLQDFLIEALQRSDIASVFLLSSSGELVSHSSYQETIANARRLYDHPISQAIKTNPITKESLEVTIQGKKYLCSVSAMQLEDLTIVSQISENQAFMALRKLTRDWVGIAILVIYLAFFASVFFSRRLTRNIVRLEKAAREVGKGNFDIEVGVDTNDELKSVAEVIQAMSHQVKDLLHESVEKARMEQELKTASLLQSTLLEPLQINLPELEVLSFFRPATECGGDFWHAVPGKNSLLLALGDATGHGASAAIVTSLAKSVFSTLSLSVGQEESPFTITDYIYYLNGSLFASAKGKLLMTLNLCQIDLQTGNLTLLNAGHEAPLSLIGGPEKGTTTKRNRTETLFVRGERLGFDPASSFAPLTRQLSFGETILLYTDGLTENQGSQEKPWGERGLKKLFAQCATQKLPAARDFLSKAFLDHVGTTPLADDVTFILLRWKKKQPVPSETAA